MLVVVIVTILAAIAIPSYQRYVTKSRRSDAITSLSAVAQAQERWRTNNASYASTLAELGLPENSNNRHYTMSLSGIGNPAGFSSGYEVHAVPASSSPQSGDDECADIAIRVQGGQLLYLATNSSSASSASICWPQ